MILQRIAVYLYHHVCGVSLVNMPLIHKVILFWVWLQWRCVPDHYKAKNKWKKVELRILFAISNILAHVICGKWKDFHVRIRLQFVTIEGITQFPLWIWCTLMLHINNNRMLVLHHFITLSIGWIQIRNWEGIMPYV